MMSRCSCVRAARSVTTALLVSSVVAFWLITPALAADDLASNARAEVRAVLARPEFQPLADADRLPDIPQMEFGWMESLFSVWRELFGGVIGVIGDALGAVLGQFIRGLQNLFGGLGAAGGAATAGIFSTIITWLLVVLGVALIVWLLIRLSASRAAERQAGAAALSVTTAGAGEDDALARSPEDWRRRAERLAGEGDRVEALRALYLELLAGLHRAGAINYDRTRTNTAYVFDLARGHAARAPFVSLTGRFDRAVYGAHEPAEIDVRDAMAEVSDVRAAFVREVVDA